MNRYSKYFLNHLLWLDDGFCQYYLQNPSWNTGDILDVQVVVFDWPEDAEQWLVQCAEHDPATTLRHLRVYLADHCPEHYSLHQMNNHRVIKAAARRISLSRHRIVIKPRYGWAVQVDKHTQEPAQPVSVEPGPDVDSLLDELKVHLDAIVADRQSQTEELEAKLAEMNFIQRNWEFQKRAIRSSAKFKMAKDALDTIRSIPEGFKAIGKLLAIQGDLFEALVDSVRAGSMEPINQEFEKAIAPLVETAEQAKKATAMVQVLLSDEDTYALFYDFGERYVKAMHPLDRMEYGMKAVNAVVILIGSIVATIYTGGVSGAAQAG